MTAAQRLADRRERLLTAGYSQFADAGFPVTTIERLCATARISNRAFYECFPGRDELMRAVYERCVDETMTAVTRAVGAAPADLGARIEAGIREYITFVTRDARRARIMNLEVRRAGDAVTVSRQRTVTAFARLIENSVAEFPESVPADPHLVVLGIIGAIQELLIDWVLAPKPPPVERLIRASVHIFQKSFAP
jgi:AcrR family transcriptional regulator